MKIDLGLIDYVKAYKLQKELVERRRLDEIDDCVILAEHEAVFTIGRLGDARNLLVPQESLNSPLVRVDRGGDITFHGPGQLVAYPIIDLRARQKDLHRYLKDIEEVVIIFLKKYSVEGARVKGRTGVWVDGKKIAFIGIGAKDWVTYHGFSININADLSYFSLMNPCGLKGISVTNLADVLSKRITMADVKDVLTDSFDRVFGPVKESPVHETASLLA
ncbi:MAG: lipoyl(octanoyl) transferase LipB [Candidatus Omnitrophica bacterium]|nr:lipoyl(octanoyl) transferase LipB [Candidatus Omnitrophota bacterium]